MVQQHELDLLVRVRGKGYGVAVESVVEQHELDVGRGLVRGWS